ncbi:MAG: hypothetical protein II942_01225 [Alphaproteobacteria bacterium]|nr:hypothetical protein [Alphaproteobacteria bacterium]
MKSELQKFGEGVILQSQGLGEEINQVTETFELAVELSKRYQAASFYVMATAMCFPMNKRHQIAEHIRNAANQAKTDVVLANLNLKRDLTRDLWGEINRAPSVRKERLNKVSDFAAMVATLPHNSPDLKRILNAIERTSVPQQTRSR